MKIGGPAGIRTPDIQLRRLAPYPARPRAHYSKVILKAYYKLPLQNRTFIIADPFDRSGETLTETIEALVEGGKATPGPPLGPALGPLGVNIGEIIKTINEKTKDFDGMKVPVKVKVNPKTKAFEISIGTPPVSALVLAEIGIDKGSGARLDSVAGNLTIEQAAKIARMKTDSLLGNDMKARVKEVVGSCVSMGVTVEGRDPKAAIKAIDAGDLIVPE